MGQGMRDLPSRSKAEAIPGQFLTLGSQAVKAEFPFDPEWRNLNHGRDGP